MDSSEPLIVRAVYSFKASNNDEISFKKGDIITVTQMDEGWWEGTLDGKTGWFPSNYVKECKDAQKPTINSPNQYKEVVLKDLIDSEKAHVAELLSLVTNFLQPLEKSSTLTPDEYKQLTGNINEVLEVHQQLLSLIESESTKPGLEQRVGRLFLTWASRVKNVYQIYCSLHPRAVCILDKYKDELTKYMESKGASSPGVLVLTVLLSKPFRRLEKYSGMLQELERHVEESHPDRGDTQRSVAVYKEIANTCAATRRQKELELQVMSGPIRGWEGPPVSTLGEIIYMGSVAVGSHHHDRYFVLFPSVLLILAVSHRLSAFIFEGKLCLSGITAKRLEDTDEYKNAFEIQGSLIEKRIAICQSKDEANHWVELLTKQQKPRATSDVVVGKGTRFVHGKSIGLPTATMSDQNNRNTSHKSCSSLSSTPHQYVGPTPFRPVRDWTSFSLRPTPPLRPCLGLGRASTKDPYTRYPHNTLTYKEDGYIFEVIESYCSNGKPRSATNSVNLNNGPKTELVSKKVEDEVVLLQMQTHQLEYNVNAILRTLHEERKARYALQTIVKNFMQVNCKEFHNIEWPAMETNN